MTVPAARINLTQVSKKPGSQMLTITPLLLSNLMVSKFIMPIEQKKQVEVWLSFTDPV